MKALLQNFLLQSSTTKTFEPAVKFADKSYNYQILNQKSSALAAYLQKNGIQEGDRVVILFGNTLETIISFWAILKAGAVVVPVGLDLKPEKISYILKDSGATALFTNEDIAKKCDEILNQSKLKRILITAAGGYNNSDPRYTLFDTAVSSDHLPVPLKTISVDLAAIIYTSGSTGEPKGVMLTHQNMIAATNSLNTYLSYQSTDKILCALPLSFDYGLYQMIMSVSRGATLLLEKEFTWPIFLLKTIVQQKATILPAVPTMVMMLYEQNKKSAMDLSTIRMVTNTGAALTETNIKMAQALFPEAEIFSMYGLTECKRCTYLPPGEINTKPNSVGIAIPNTELWLVDDENQKITEPNQIGQLVIRGATVMQGYWNKPKKTAEKLRPGKIPGEYVLYTGDYCTLDQDGYLYFKGRMDHMIKSRGIKVSPKEVEDYISRMEEVQAVLVIGVPDNDYGEVLFVFVVIEEEKQISPEKIIRRCQQGLEAYKVPEHVSIIKAMPKTPNGKFDVIKLKAKAIAEVEAKMKIV